MKEITAEGGTNWGVRRLMSLSYFGKKTKDSFVVAGNAMLTAGTKVPAGSLTYDP